MKLFKDKTWWDNMSANFVGAFLGIVITFGTTALIDDIARHRMAKKAALITIAQLDNEIMQMEYTVEEMRHKDSILSYVAGRYPDKIDDISADTIRMFWQYVKMPPIYLHDHSAANIFSGSIEMWKDFDDLELLNSINECFAAQNHVLEFFSDINDYQRETFNEFSSAKRTTEYDDIWELTEAYIAHPAVYDFIRTHSLYTTLLPLFVQLIKDTNQTNKQMAGVSDEELFAMFPSIYEDDETEDID